MLAMGAEVLAIGGTGALVDANGADGGPVTGATWAGEGALGGATLAAGRVANGRMTSSSLSRAIALAANMPDAASRSGAGGRNFMPAP